MTQKPRILVTSAAGRTGAAAVHELLAKGFPVRAFVRREDARPSSSDWRCSTRARNLRHRPLADRHGR